jgi:uncharacterized protein with von Willebrand factor type A (vWA) domain
MTPRVLTFIHLLREHGLRISVAESLDALHSINHVGLHNRDLLRLGLRTALVKSHQDFATFDALFERFFRVPRRRKRRRTRQQQGGDDALGQRPTAHTNGNLAPPTQPPTPNAPASMTQVSQPDQHNSTADISSQAEALDALADLEHAWQQQLKAQPLRVPSEHPDINNIPARVRLDRPFPPDHLAEMYREVERLAVRLLTRRALRYRRARHGRLDLRRTVVQGLRSGREVPFTLLRRRRHVNKLRLILLCDVSGSVWQVSTFLLKLVHTLQTEFTSVRSLLFVNGIVEVTPLFRRMRFPQDLDTLRHSPNLNLFGFSDFGRAFYQFYRDFLGDLTRDTVILILGDARNNAFDPQAWTLGDIRQRCKRLIWLNPEPRREWNTGDSVLDAYAPHCDHILECWRLDHLVQAADLLWQA